MPRCAPASAAEARKAGETNLPGPDIVIEGASKWGAIQTAMDICANDGAVVVVARHYDAPDFNPVRSQPPLRRPAVLEACCRAAELFVFMPFCSQPLLERPS